MGSIFPALGVTGSALENRKNVLRGVKMVFFKRLKKKKILMRLQLLIIFITLLFVIQGILSLKYFGDLTISSEKIYQQTTKGTIEIRLLEEQLSKIETLYALGLAGKSDKIKIQNLASEAIANLATLIKIYPDNQFIVNISNQVISMIKMFDNIEKEGFVGSVMDELRLRNKKIKDDLIAFKASKRLKGSLAIKFTETLSQSSRNKFLILCVIGGFLVCVLGFHITRALSTRLQKVSLSADLSARSLTNRQTAEEKVRESRKDSAEPVWLSEMNEREKEILALLAQGYTNKEIANRIYIAEQTVKNYVCNIYSKIDVHDRVQASIKAIEAGLNGKN